MELYPGAGVKNYPSDSPSFLIQHLCGYYYTDDKYKKEAEKLRSFGFECLRSQRGEDGRFWELWFLPGAWAAKGELKLAIRESEINEKTKVDETMMIDFLRRNCSFGTMDVMAQRLAMVID